MKKSNTACAILCRLLLGVLVVCSLLPVHALAAEYDSEPLGGKIAVDSEGESTQDKRADDGEQNTPADDTSLNGTDSVYDADSDDTKTDNSDCATDTDERIKEAAEALALQSITIDPTALLAPPEDAATITEGTYVLHPTHSLFRVIDIWGASSANGAAATLFDYHGNSNQLFRFEKDS
ncbi:MAG: hypothetical protein LBC35_01820, partial [Coriobacteriales bacterium]|nr:hypothetical protein [Coriobacteriales bacterium]